MEQRSFGFGLASAVLVLMFAGAPGALAGEALSDVPASADAKAHYLFYMHGAWIEMHGEDRPHPAFGRYRYRDNVEALAKRGFVVISEARPVNTRFPAYAAKVAGQVRRLLDQGVPPGNVTVIGHSKGGMITLIVATMLAESKVNFVVMAGCGRKGTQFRRGFQRFLANSAAQLQGRILSIYDVADRDAGSCKEAFTKAPGIGSKEVVFQGGKGHGLFYAPRESWIEAVEKWAGL